MLTSPPFKPDGIGGALAAWIPVRCEEYALKWVFFLELTFVEKHSVDVRLFDESIIIKAALLGDFWKPGLSGFSHHHGQMQIRLPAGVNPASVTAHHFKDLLTIEVEKRDTRKVRHVPVSHSPSKTKREN